MFLCEVTYGLWIYSCLQISNIYQNHQICSDMNLFISHEDDPNGWHISSTKTFPHTSFNLYSKHILITCQNKYPITLYVILTNYHVSTMLPWCGMERYDTTKIKCMAWHGMVYDMIWYDMIWYDMIYDTIWYDTSCITSSWTQILPLGVIYHIVICLFLTHDTWVELNISPKHANALWATWNR